MTDLVRSLARNSRCQRRFGFWLCSWILFFCLPLYAIDRGRRIDELYHTSWTYTEGAPGEVHALAQTTDGYLWLGTATGLFRFDGIRFEPYKPRSGQAFPQRNVVSLLAVPGGGLWVGYWYGGVSFIRNGAVTDYGKAAGLPSEAVLAFARDRQGAIWIAAGKGGLARLEGSRWRKIGNDWGFAGPADTVFVDHAGTLWVGTPTTVAYLVEGRHHFQIAAQHLRPIVESLAEAPDGTLWMAEGGYGVRPVPLPGKNDGRSGPAVLVGAPAITFDSQGSLWITTAGDGIRRVPYPGRLHAPKIKGPSAWRFHNSEVEAFTQQNGLTGDYAHCVLQDREGNVWIGTTDGLDRFRQSPVVSVPLQPISYPGALPIPSLHSFTTSALAAGDEGALWAAGIGPQVLLKIQNDKTVTQLRDQPVDCAYRDPNGVLWFATPRAVFCLTHKRLDTIGSEPGAAAYNYHGAVPAGQGLIERQLDLPTAGRITVSPQSRVKAMTQDRLGRLWISMGSGTFRLEGSSWTSLESLGGPRGTATAEFTDSKGRIWFGFANTVAMLDGDKVSTFSRKDGVQVGAVTSIRGQGTKIWIGGEFGLEFFDGSRFQPVNPSDGGAFAGVSGIVADPEDGLWFSDNQGIIHIPEAQLRQLGSGKLEFESFGLEDGLTAELRGALAAPSAVETTDGRIWFATTKGVAWINPKRILRNPVPPPVLIQSVIANGRKYNISTSFKLPPRTTNMRITYTATSLTSPARVRFRYKLEGEDREWQDAGTRREAFYTKLDPGSYQFHVIASNNDGVWNDAGASLNFSIARAYYQTLWFRAACLALFLVLIWMLYRLRVHSIERRYREQKRVEEALRRSEGDLADAQKLSHTGSWHWSIGTAEITWSQELFAIFGFDAQKDKASYELYLERIHPEDRSRIEEARRAAVRERQHFEAEYRLLLPGGLIKHLHSIGHCLVTESGDVEYIGAIMDITERKRAEEERERLREAQRVVVETASDAVVSADESGAIQLANPATTRVFGYDPKELIGKPLTILMPEYMRKLHQNGFRRYLATGQRHLNWERIELVGLRKNGQEFPVAVSFGELTMNGHRLFTGFIRDITEIKQAEEERERLRQVQANLAHMNRVSTMGELTASLAHEIKQPIGAAVTNAEACARLLDRNQPDLPEAREAALEMARDARRAADIIEHVRSLYRKDSSQQETVDLNEVIREMVVLLQNEANRHSVTMRAELTEGLPTVMADRVQLQQALMNLMLNGIEAMPEMSGELRIKSQIGEDGQVLISVSDTGVGLPAGTTDEIFNAFFTTKSEGTGLGLAITRSIIESHGGHIWATANSGPGATFQFTLPPKSAAHA